MAGLLVDPRSIAIFAVFIGLIVAFTMVYFLKARKAFRGFGLWTAASVLFAFGQALFSLQGFASPWISIVMANVALVLAFQWVLRGLWRFAGGEPPIFVDAVLAAYMAVALTLLTYVYPSLAGRIINFCAVSLAQTIASVIAARELARKTGMKANACLMGGFLAIISLSLVRGGLALALGVGGYRNILESSTQAVMLMLYSGAYVLTFIGLQIQNAQRVEDELTKAAEEVRTLSGIIPICSHCKKVRNDSGYWEQVEAYVSRMTEAGFSHGICPDCLEKLFPEQAAQIGRKGKA